MFAGTVRRVLQGADNACGAFVEERLSASAAGN